MSAFLKVQRIDDCVTVSRSEYLNEEAKSDLRPNRLLHPHQDRGSAPHAQSLVAI
jgi:hypothetical protein